MIEISHSAEEGPKPRKLVHRPHLRGPTATRNIMGLFSVLLFFLMRAAAVTQAQLLGDPCNPSPTAAAAAGASTTEGLPGRVSLEEVAGQWKEILQKLDPDDQARLLEIAAEKEAAAAAARRSLAEKDSEIAALREALAQGADEATTTEKDGTAMSTSRRLTVSGESYTALSALYVATSGAYWNEKANWMNGDPCTAGW